MFVLGFKVYFLLTMHIHYDWFHNLHLSDAVVKFMWNDCAAAQALWCLV